MSHVLGLWADDDYPLAAAKGFSAWSASHAGLTDSTALGDPDRDRIPNVLEYVLNGNPAVASAADTTQLFQYGMVLSHWTDVSLTPPTDAKVTLGAEDGAGIQPVTVTITKSPNSTMFGRLLVAQP